MFSGEFLGEERGVFGEFGHISAGVITGRLRQRCPGANVFFGDISKREIDPTSFKTTERKRKALAAFVFHSLHAVKELLLEAIPAKNLQVAITEPLLDDDAA